MKRIFGVLCCLALVIMVAMSPKQLVEGSVLLPFLSRQANHEHELDLWRDSFKILEHIPFELNRDDYLEVSPVKLDWKETPQAHSIIMDVPGLKREDLKIEVGENRVLRVSGERRKEIIREEEKNKGGGEHWHCVERSYGKFWRQFRLPENANLDSVQARLQDGVLTITLPKLSPDKIKGPKLVAIDHVPGSDGHDQQSKLTTHDYVKQEL